MTNLILAVAFTLGVFVGGIILWWWLNWLNINLEEDL
jgi:hypothetical protein